MIMRTYFLTELRRIVRSRKVLALTAAYPAVLYLVIGPTFDDGSSQGGISVRSYVMVSMALFGATGSALAVSGVISAEREGGWTRQLRLTPLPGWAYVTGKIATALVSAAVSIALVFAVAALTGGGGTVSHTLLAAVVLLIGMAPFAALGVFFGYLAVGQANRPLVMFSWMGLSILGGLWFPLDNMPQVVRSISEVTPTYQLADLSRRALAGDVPTMNGLAVLAAWTVLASALAAWRYRADTVSATPALA
jgi:ABC-2 type transport system permease protein